MIWQIIRLSPLKLIYNSTHTILPMVVSSGNGVLWCYEVYKLSDLIHSSQRFRLLFKTWKVTKDLRRCLSLWHDMPFFPWYSMLSRFSHVWLFATLWTIAHQAPLSSGFSSQEYWSGLPCPPLGIVCVNSGKSEIPRAQGNPSGGVSITFSFLKIAKYFISDCLGRQDEGVTFMETLLSWNLFRVFIEHIPTCQVLF